MRKWFFCGILAVCLGMLGAGCARKPSVELSYGDLLSAMTNYDLIANLSAPGCRIVTSYDPTGGNDDFGHFMADGPPGWKIIADLKGPGYVSRFWCTGSKDGLKRIRFYFDGEKQPSIETTLDRWFGAAGVLDPLPVRGYEPYCWFSWIPIPYSRRLVVMEEAAVAGEKLYYQLNYVPLPPGFGMQSLSPQTLSDPAVTAKLEEIRQAWRARQNERPHAADATSLVEVVLAPAMPQDLFKASGGGTIEEVAFAPRWPEKMTMLERDALLRGVVVRMYWDNQPAPSVEVPLGALCGSLWRAIGYSSAYFGLRDGWFFVRFPMPFQSGARVELVNQAAQPMMLGFNVTWHSTGSRDAAGYFHGSWRKSPATAVGSPHTILRASGRGRYAGCILGVRSLDKNWWALEGDEAMYVDGAQTPFWRGTGLEDYFNGGWYYGNTLADPFHGIVFKAPARTVQYRLHLLDPVCFQNGFSMTFERGPDQNSQAEMESVAFYYLDAPQKADSEVGDAISRVPVPDPLESQTLMTETLNMERLGDIEGAVATLTRYLEQYPDTPVRALIEARIAAYRNPPPPAPGAARVGVYANMPVRLYVDGELKAEVRDPKAERMHFYDVPLAAGRHVFAVQAVRQAYPDWVQVAVQTHKGIWGTDRTWRFAFNPGGEWMKPGYDDSSWPRLDYTWVKGPPEWPYLWCEPNPYPFLQSVAWGIRPSKEWPAAQGFVVYRKDFVVE